jgi:radical SAM superfamily enzyme YgiQ (UPF0313 family)
MAIVLSETGFDPPRPLAVCLINPKFQPSFWGYDFALPLMPGDKRSWVVTGALPALAALAPPHCSVTLIDENVEPIDFAALARFDVIGVTGMIVQGERMKAILAALRALPAWVVAGGPYVSVAEHEFATLCDTRFVGEAEETWPRFLTDLAAGQPVPARYEQAGRTDMRTVPSPRYDLVQADRYLMASLQFSRGCPFMCEFCDIITIFGRRPRLKSVEQMIEEFDGVRRAGFRLCFLVDDNLIGNKAGAKQLLRALCEWQRRHGYPLQLYAEASINLAEDDEMIELMVRANVRQVFIGIESPRAASLAETRKVQNVRGGSLESKVQMIRDGGLVVQAGFIVGFDNDDERIFDDQFDFIQRTGIAQALVAILSPTPTTPLYDRLLVEERLDFADPDVTFLPSRMSRETLKQGYGLLMRRLYAPEAYFERLFQGLASSPAFRHRRAALEADIRAARPGRRPARWLGALAAVRQGTQLWRSLARSGLRRQVGGAYLRAWFRHNAALGAHGLPLGTFVGLCVIHWHFFNIARLPRTGAFGAVQAPRAPAQLLRAGA